MKLWAWRNESGIIKDLILQKYFNRTVMLRWNLNNLIGWKWLHDLRQPITTPEFERTITLCWKYFYTWSNKENISVNLRCAEIWPFLLTDKSHMSIFDQLDCSNSSVRVNLRWKHFDRIKSTFNEIFIMVEMAFSSACATTDSRWGRSTSPGTSSSTSSCRPSSRFRPTWWEPPQISC